MKENVEGPTFIMVIDYPSVCLELAVSWEPLPLTAATLGC